jgi:hypothetical protein
MGERRPDAGRTEVAIDGSRRAAALGLGAFAMTRDRFRRWVN